MNTCPATRDSRELPAADPQKRSIADGVMSEFIEKGSKHSNRRWGVIGVGVGTVGAVCACGAGAHPENPERCARGHQRRAVPSIARKDEAIVAPPDTSPLGENPTAFDVAMWRRGCLARQMQLQEQRVEASASRGQRRLELRCPIDLQRALQAAQADVERLAPPAPPLRPEREESTEDFDRLTIDELHFYAALTHKAHGVEDRFDPAITFSGPTKVRAISGFPATVPNANRDTRMARRQRGALARGARPASTQRRDQPAR